MKIVKEVRLIWGPPDKDGPVLIGSANSTKRALAIARAYKGAYVRGPYTQAEAYKIAAAAGYVLL